MQIFAISALINALVAIALGLFVISYNPHNKVNRLYFLLGLAVAFWSAGYWQWQSSNIEATALFWTRILSMGSTMIPVFYFHWVMALLERDKKEKRAIIFTYIFAFIILLFSFSPLFIKDVRPKMFFQFWPDPGILYHFYLAYVYCILVTYSLFLLTKEYKKSFGEKKAQIIYVIIGSVVGFGGGIFNFFLWYNIPIPPYGNFLVALYPFFLGYAVIKYRLFEVKIVVTEILIFLLWIFLLIKTLISNNFQDLLINGGILCAIIIIGILLIRGIIKEVKQKEKMEKMAKDIEKAYEAEKSAKEKIDAIRVEDEALLTSIGDGVIAIDKFGKIMFINRVAQELLAIKNQDVINKPYEEVLFIENEKGEAIVKEKNPLYLALSSGKETVTDATGGLAKTTYYYVKKNKAKFPAAVTVAPVVLDGKIIGAIDVFRDVTVERQIDKSKSEFVSLASHQLRTPLTAIKWYSELILKDKSTKLSAGQKKYLKEIHKGNERMIGLIDVMLNVSRLEAGKIPNNPVKINIKKFIEDIVEEQNFTIKKKEQKFIFECPDNLPEIFADANLIRMVFQNLISNAVKYTPDRGTISCIINKNEKQISFKISDTGIGIPEDQQKRVFEKLFRASNASSHDPEGNGLGLYLAKSTVENLGGKIRFESKEGEGTTFFITLPLESVKA